MIKNNGSEGKGHYKEREVKVILENIEGQFRVFGEGMTNVQDRLERLEGKVDRIETDMSIVKAAIPPIFSRLAALESSR